MTLAAPFPNYQTNSIRNQFSVDNARTIGEENPDQISFKGLGITSPSKSELEITP